MSSFALEPVAAFSDSFLKTRTLHAMLSYRRPAFSKTEEQFIKRFILPLGVARDGFDNLILRIGDAPILWSCHTDTVHRQDGIQGVAMNDSRYVVDASSKDSNCLGADCTTGVWLMAEMIKAKVPGLYIFHRAEEIGGHGSSYIAEKTPQLLNGIKIAVAFDRKGRDSIITHQAGGRCASQEFAASLGKQLKGFQADAGGTFTDTANYVHLIPECTNLSVGYENAHSADESQCAVFALALLEAIKSLNVDALTVSRDPAAPDYDDWFNDYGYGNARAAAQRYGRNTMVDLVTEYPEEIASMLEDMGYEADELERVIDQMWNGTRHRA